MVEDVEQHQKSPLAATAYHEAGHAVMALSLGRPIEKVTVEARQLQLGGKRLGACEIRKGRTRKAKDWIEDEVLILLAGMVAEARFTGQYCKLGATEDLRGVRRMLRTRATNERQLERLERRMLDKAEHIFHDQGHALAIELIAAELLNKPTISGRAVRHFFNQALQQTS